jgi:putative PIN family toxin of toxin-antitoxin system
VRAVLDTNIYISALALPGSIAEEALQRAAFKRYDLVTSPAILAELANVLTRKFDWDAAHALEACREIADLAVVVRPTRRIDVLQDKPDNRLLECAIAGKADRLVTGDKHLLSLGHYEGVAIVRLVDFLKETT